MTIDTNSDQNPADVEALNWIVALQEDPDDAALLERFARWCAAAATNRLAWEEASRVYGRIGEVSPLHSAHWKQLGEQRLTRAEPQVAGSRRHRQASGSKRSAHGERGPGRRLVTAALSAAAAVVIIVAAPEMTLRWKADAVTGAGELKAMMLADGSHVSLSPGSAISVDYSESQRQIRLLRGQAWFEVQDDARPFRVMARNIETTDIGTAFEVGLSGDAVRVAVGHGIVRVDDTKTRQTISDQLVAGQNVLIGSTGVVRHGVAPVELIGAWRDARLTVQDRSVEEVVAALRPWYRGVIIVRPGAHARRRVTGVFNLRDTVGAMEALTKAHGGRVTQITPWVLILSGD